MGHVHKWLLRFLLVWFVIFLAFSTTSSDVVPKNRKNDESPGIFNTIRNKFGKNKGSENINKGNNKNKNDKDNKSTNNEEKRILNHYRIGSLWDHFIDFNEQHKSGKFSRLATKLIDANKWTNINNKELKSIEKHLKNISKNDFSEFEKLIERFKQCENLLNENDLGYLWPSLREHGWDDIDIWKNSKLLTNKRMKKELKWKMSDITKFRHKIAPTGDDSNTNDDNANGGSSESSNDGSADSDDDSGSGFWETVINSISSGFFKYITHIIFSAITVVVGVISTRFSDLFKYFRGQKIDNSSDNNNNNNNRKQGNDETLNPGVIDSAARDVVGEGSQHAG